MVIFERVNSKTLNIVLDPSIDIHKSIDILFSLLEYVEESTPNGDMVEGVLLKPYLLQITYKVPAFIATVNPLVSNLIEEIKGLLERIMKNKKDFNYIVM